jgi:regulator of replication initiation timing
MQVEDWLDMFITRKKHEEILSKFVSTLNTYSEENYYLREENAKLKKKIEYTKAVAKGTAPAKKPATKKAAAKKEDK